MTTMSRQEVLSSKAAADSSATDTAIAEPESDAAVPTELETADAPEEPIAKVRRFNWTRMVVYGVLPALAMLLALGAGFGKWQEAVSTDHTAARAESLRAATDSTVALLSYQANSVEQQLESARDLLAGDFRESYTKLITEVVIPGAKEKQISVTATVPAVASVSANEIHAVALVFVNQTTVIGTDPPTDTTSTIRVTMDKVDGRWLISEFDPV